MPLIAIRHGETEHNLPGQEHLRGWRPVPLTIEGMRNNMAISQMLKPLLPDVKHVYCSDLVRAVQSAEDFGLTLGLAIAPLEALRDWNTGNLAGQQITNEIIKTLHTYIKNERTPIPGGEPYATFKNRVLPFFAKCIASPDNEVCIVHGRETTLLTAMAKSGGKEPDLETLMNAPPVGPSGIMVVGRGWTIHYQSPKPKSITRQS